MRHLALIATLLLLQAESPSEPAPRTKEYPWMSVASWKERHDKFLRRAREGDIDLLFLGDSITEGWANNAVWQKHYAPLKAANFGIGGDTTQNVLWRLLNGEVEGIIPRVAVLMIGTNNFGLHGDAPDAVARGVATVVQTLRKKLPRTRVLLLAIFPRDEKPGTPMRLKIQKTNEQIARLHDGKAACFLDIGPKFLAPDGTLSREIMPDFLHLSEKGYGIWAEAMNPLLKKMMGK